MSFNANLDDIVTENRNGLLGVRSGWSRIKLREVVKILNGAPFESARFNKDRGTPLIRIRDIMRGQTETFYDGDFEDTYLVHEGDLLVGMDGDFNCALWTGKPALLNQRVCKLTPDESRYDKRFLLLVLPGYLAAINANTPSVTVKHLSSRTVGDIPLPLPPLSAIVEVMAPAPGQTICDPACGTGGFLLAAFDHLSKLPHLDRAQKKALKNGTFHGIELVDSVTRLCAMNMLLHGIGGESDTTDLPVTTKDALTGKHGEYDIVLANPPFGKKSSVTIIGADGEQSKESLTINRDDFWATTSNKQLNFLQHIFTILKQHGHAAVVLPDNVLFEGGAGETIRRQLLQQADVHTLLRLPTGIFYAQGVKANVLFFDRKPAADKKAWTEKLWIYDLRTNQHFTLKENTLKRSHLDDFVACYNPKNRHARVETERFKSFTYDELIKRDKVNLDIFWLKDEALEDSANLPAPGIIATEIVEDLRAALAQFEEIEADLKE